MEATENTTKHIDIKPERHKPWKMTTIREVLHTMRLLIEQEECDFDTPIVWYHLENGNLTSVEHSGCHVFNDGEEEHVELTLKDPYTDSDGHWPEEAPK